MNKDIFRYIFVFAALYLVGFYTHEFSISSNGGELRFSLEKIYLFHAFFSGLICVNIRIAATVDKLFPQLGFLYVATLIVKLILFAVFFYSTVFNSGQLTVTEKISLLIPLFIFLLTEALFVVKILKNTDKKTIQ